MNMPSSWRPLAVIVFAAALGGAAIVGLRDAQRDPIDEPPTPGIEEPSLNCAFHSYTNSELVAGFDFGATFPDGAPRFEERARGVLGKGRTNHETDDRPVWTFAYIDELPTITSPDETTRIVLYGLKLGTAGTHYIEAGVRSNEFRNLGGTCRQVNFAAAAPAR